MLVVVLLIGVVLGLGLPAFNTIAKQSRLSQARQQLNGVLTRAYTLSLADRALTAVRLFPAEWEAGDSRSDIGGNTDAESRALVRDRQAAGIYRYAGATADPTDPSKVLYTERFERAANAPVVVLPTDVWAAPAEALVGGSTNLTDQAEAILRGPLYSGLCRDFNAVEGAGTSKRNSDVFLDMDDFLIVFDSEGGVLRRQPAPSWPMRMFDPRESTGNCSSPTGQTEVARDGLDADDPELERFSFSGLVLYEREVMKALGSDAQSDTEVADRATVLERLNLRYYVSRGGSLIGAQP